MVQMVKYGEKWRETKKENVNIVMYTVEYFTHFGSFDALYSVGISRLSSISTISTSPDWISAVPSHEIIIGIQSAPDVQFSGIWKALNKKKVLLCCFYIYLLYTLASTFHIECMRFEVYLFYICIIFIFIR